MSSGRFWVLSLLLAASGGAGALRAADGWTELKAGMTLDQVRTTVGAPLIKSQGRGIVLWIYDHGGEAVATGGVLVAWTEPAKTAKPLPRVTPEAAKVASPAPLPEVKNEARSQGEKPVLRLPLA